MSPAVVAPLALLLLPALALAATGGTAISVSHDGYLLDAGDTPVTGTRALSFAIFDAASAGTLEWSGACASVPVKSGYYAVSLGSAACAGTGGASDSVLDTSDLPPTASRWLEVTVGATTLSPRLLLSPQPAAARAYDAERLGGRPATDFALAGHVHEIAQVTGLSASLAAKISTESDPKVGALAVGKWCTSDGFQVNCTSDAPEGGSGGTGGQATGGVAVPAACAPATVGYFWFDTSSSAVKVCNGADYVNVASVQAPPGAPASVTAVGANSAITVSWPAVANATSYEVAHQSGGSLDASATITAVGSGLSVNLGSLTNGQQYTVAVRSVRGAWKSVWSVPAQATPMPVWSCSGTPTHAGCVSSSQYATCLAIKNDPTFAGGSGNYWIDPDGATGAAPFLAYCDMSTTVNGVTGGWTLVARQISTTASSTLAVANAVGTLTGPTQGGAAKLSDATINAIGGGAASQVFLQDCASRVNYYKGITFSATVTTWSSIQISTNGTTYFSVAANYGSCSNGLHGCDCSTGGCWGHNAGRAPGALYGALGGFGFTNGCIYTDSPGAAGGWAVGNGTTWVR